MIHETLTPEEYTDLVLDIAYFRADILSLPEFYRSPAAIELLCEVALDLILNDTTAGQADEELYSTDINFWLLLREDVTKRGI